MYWPTEENIHTKRMGKMYTLSQTSKTKPINRKIFYVQSIQVQGTGDLDKNTTLSITTPPPTLKQCEDLYDSMKLFLRLGRILGLVPLKGLLNKRTTVAQLCFKWNSLAVYTAILWILALGANTVFSFISLVKRCVSGTTGNAVDWAFAARGPFFYLTVFLIHIFFLQKGEKLISLFTTWRKIATELKLKQCDSGLSRSVNRYTFAIYGTSIIQMILLYLNNFPAFPSIEGETRNGTHLEALEAYYQAAHHVWAIYINYHAALAVLLLIIDLISVHAWIFADLLIIVFSRALYFKFKVLVEETEKKLLMKSVENRKIYKLNGITWGEVRTDHLMICKLLEEFQKFLSPLIFLSYSINIFFICLLLHQGLTPYQNQTIIASLGAVGAFIHLIFRTMMVSVVASKINEYAHRVIIPIQKCSSVDYCNEVERLERMLGIDPIGLNGLGCFVITRAFMLVVISVIFTIEVVLLQTSTFGLQLPTPTGKSTEPILPTIAP